ncbi:hypothetical protein Rsub_01675 [Raphidocelis subcapitata]|uniref:Uncharacterized protein n=1 Tax=Raphidocelis subcapitata TaxID=307507 RepID=A0A2V0NMN8_9CHLO|nr:hypothetical protein Rsub_01675 [Raphidocelis subcapitata]|eukprot:GBF88774.1 hypothetical protein Rsub_01675 [Raphidocelis subcapitata]
MAVHAQRQGPSAVLPTAPAFSFGSLPMPPLTGDTGPGPGAYFTQQIARRPGGHSVLSTAPSAPAATIRVRPLDARLGGGATPGPGEYEPRDGLLRRGAPMFTFKGVEARDVRSRNPSVGAYNPREALLHPAAPVVSISLKHPPPESYEKRPAPGEYDRAASYRAKSPLPVTLKFRRPPPPSERPESGHAVPGPGEYGPRPPPRGPAFSLGARWREPGAAAKRAAAGAPGPGFYEVYRSTIGLAGRMARAAAGEAVDC